MSPEQEITAFAQSVYLRIKNRQYDDIASTDGQAYIANIIDFANGFLDELENEVNPNGTPLDWKWSYQLGAALGTATAGASSITAPNTVLNLIASEQRYVQVLHDGTPVANFLVVAPDDITNKRNAYTEDMVTFTGTGTLTFSRPFNAHEDGGTIIGDVTNPFPRLSHTNTKVLHIVKPRELLILGVAKNASLPDIVKGTLSPSYVQKYQDLFNGAVARNMATATAGKQQRDDLSFISGVGF